MDDQRDAYAQRATFLSAILGIMGGSLFLFFLFIACGGLFYAVLAVVGGMAFVGFFHYWLWGQSLNAEVAGEREEEELRAGMDEDDWPMEDPGLRRRF